MSVIRMQHTSVFTLNRAWAVPFVMLGAKTDLLGDVGCAFLMGVRGAELIVT